VERDTVTRVARWYILKQKCPIWVNFGANFMPIWSILRLLIHFAVIRYILPRFGMMYQNLATLAGTEMKKNILGGSGRSTPGPGMASSSSSELTPLEGSWSSHEATVKPGLQEQQKRIRFFFIRQFLISVRFYVRVNLALRPEFTDKA
jgi:hypothetical protein